MSSRAYIRVEPQEGQNPDNMGMIDYWGSVSFDDGSDPEEFDFQAPAGLVVDGEFPVPPRAKMWVAGALAELSFHVEDALDTLLPLGRVSLEAGLPSDESTLRGGGQRLAWVSSESLSSLGKDCHKRDVQWVLEQTLSPGLSSRPRVRL